MTVLNASILFWMSALTCVLGLPQNNRGFGTIVTPEPILDPTTSPQIFNASTEDECVCVRYHLCDPNTETVRAEAGEDEDETNGFGIIDIRFNPNSCQHYLDVCCKSGDQKEESISLPPITSKPKRASGCGIRNVGGIDFKLTGNMVMTTSDEY